MTYPLIGNYGINPRTSESRRPWLRGFVVKRVLARTPSNWRARATSLDDLPARAGISGIEGIDTRALTRRLRDQGAMRGLISTDGAWTPTGSRRRRGAPQHGRAGPGAAR